MSPLRKGAGAAQTAARPTCKPCKRHECSKCATALAVEGIIDSDFECACYHDDPRGHDTEVQESQENPPWMD